MKKIVLLMMLLFITSPTWADTRTISEYDGNEWRAWDISFKTFFITGFMLGSNNVVNQNITTVWYADEQEYVKGLLSTKE